MEDPQTPGSDWNSNPANDSQDFIATEFDQDNLEYQWFIDYRDGGLHVHPSVLSSLSTSYTRQDLGYYDDLARNLDANLAEVDMESFCAADIHTLLTTLPAMCTDHVQHSEEEDSACSATSICKSSLLFSPVRETPVWPTGGSYSVDSLDCEDMLLTCQANNKNNYTIAFEGSITMYSGDDSQEFDGQEKQRELNKAQPDSLDNIAKEAKGGQDDDSMACSDSKIYTTWSNLKQSIDQPGMTRHPSGNNNTIPNLFQGGHIIPLLKNTRRSSSLPDFNNCEKDVDNDIFINISVNCPDSNTNNTARSRPPRLNSLMCRSMNDGSSASDSVGNALSSKKVQNMSLVRLFMKQKSTSAEGMSLTLDQTESASDDGWMATNSDTDSNTLIHNNNRNLDPSTESDLAINWMKPDDNFNTTRNESNNQRHSQGSNDVKKSVTKIGSLHNPAGLSKKHIIESKTTGIQAVAEVADCEIQTSLAYSVNTNHYDKLNMPSRKIVFGDKHIYVVYPSYTLPDLSFLRSRSGSTNASKMGNIALKPQNVGKYLYRTNTGKTFTGKHIDAMKQRGFSHVKDWESLTFLLPNKYRKILHDVPEVPKHIDLTAEDVKKPLFCLSPPMKHRTCTLNDVLSNVASQSSSTATQPSSGFRGSSTILTDSTMNINNQQNSINNGNPMYQCRFDSTSSEASISGGKETNNVYRKGSHANAPENSAPIMRVPRSILRNNRLVENKRCSMFEMKDQTKEVDERYYPVEDKRKSLQEPYYMNNDLQMIWRHGILVDSEKDVDEAEEQLRRNVGVADAISEAIAARPELNSSGEDVEQWEEFLQQSDFSSYSIDDLYDPNQDSESNLRSCVKRFLALKMNKEISRNIDMADLQKKTVSFASSMKPQYTDKRSIISEARHILSNKAVESHPESVFTEIKEVHKMIWSTNKAVDHLLKFWNSEPTDNKRGEHKDRNVCAQLCLSYLCPALYAIMSNGLKPHLNSTFGPIANSVWQVVEASSQQGPLTTTLNELVQKINEDDFMTEGLLKFHAFVFGLLNLQALDAWFAYLCTRESILRKHYHGNSLFVAALACATTREAVDTLLKILQPLALCPFQLDLLYQYRKLDTSFGYGVSSKLERTETARVSGVTVSPKKIRPRSCVTDYGTSHQYNKKVDEDPKKRSRRSSLCNTKFHEFDKIDFPDTYAENQNKMAARQLARRSRTPEMKDKKEEEIPKCGDLSETKFRKLQEKWELIIERSATKEPPPTTVTTPPSPCRTRTGATKSKIPRPLSSPVKQLTNIQHPKSLKAPVSSLSNPKPTASVPATTKTLLKKAAKASPKRTSRVDQENSGASRSHLTRPSSLPYRVYEGAPGAVQHRRTASNSLPRPSSVGAPRNIPGKTTPK